MKKISPIIEAEDLLKIYKDSDVMLFDVSNSKDSKLNYENGHLDSALFVDINTQLADIKEDLSKGGRHPLPTTKQFSKTLTELGISKHKHIVIYDDNNGSNAAARFWWMLKSIGHSKVQVLNGGFNTAKMIGFPINSIVEKSVKAEETYEIENWSLPIMDINQVEKASHNTEYLIVDVRSKERYDGKTEPIDLIAGHIPNAINIPFSENLDENNKFLPVNQLKVKYQNYFKNFSTDKIIIHCGSGVTACHTLLALDYAGFEIPNLYVGSWSEWSRNGKIIYTND